MYAAIGRKQTELDNLNIEYDRLLSLLKQVLSGEIDACRVTVNTSSRSWEMVELPQSPDEIKADVTVQ